jgi:hypothetical protein
METNMTQKIDLVYPEVVISFKDSSGATDIRLHNVTIPEARQMAVHLGYKRPVWYKPWQYFTGGLFILTIGFGYERGL